MEKARNASAYAGNRKHNHRDGVRVDTHQARRACVKGTRTDRDAKERLFKEIPQDQQDNQSRREAEDIDESHLRRSKLQSCDRPLVLHLADVAAKECRHDVREEGIDAHRGDHQGKPGRSLVAHGLIGNLVRDQ